MKIGISVCIATYNGSSKIIETLTALLNNNIQADEILVFIDGSTDSTVEKIKAFNHSDKITIHESINLGRASARNKVAEIAKNELLLFLDDDIIIPENTLSKHLASHIENEQQIISHPTLTISSKNDFSNFKRSLEQKWNSHQESEDEVTFSAAFFSIRNSTFNLIGGFHNGLNDAEDYEFGLRIKKCGLHVNVDKTIIGTHNDPITCKSFIIRNRQYLQANRLLIEKNILNTNKYLNPQPRFWKKVIFYFLTRNYLVRLTDKNFFTWLNQKIRFKLYDYISAGFIFYFPNKRLK
jgi:glycosyltransferase involved in cell wall biosynthesis